MLTLDALKTFGADTDDGLARCMGNKDFYFMLIGKALEDKNFKTLEDALVSGDMKAAFEASHSLKGVLGNLSLTPLYDPVNEMTELLRNGSDIDYTPYLTTLLGKKAELAELCS